MQVFEALFESIEQDAKLYGFDNLSRIAAGKALRSFEDYFLMIDSNIAERIDDDKTKAAFSDVAYGYRALMEKWVLTHPLGLAELNKTPNNKRKFSSWIFVLGAAILIFLFLFGGLKTWVAILIFVLLVLFSLILFLREKRFNENLKKDSINNLLDCIKKWIDEGVDYSNDLLSKYDVQL